MGFLGILMVNVMILMLALLSLRPVEVLQSNKECTEDDVTDQVLKGSFPLGSSEQGALDFPGLRSDIEAIG